MKRIFSVLVALCLVAALAVPALAAPELPGGTDPVIVDDFGDPFDPEPETAEVLDDAPAGVTADAEYPAGAAGTIVEEDPMPGSVVPAEDRHMTPELEAIIDKVNENYEDEGYEGRGLLSTQVVSGTMYTFVASHWVMREDNSFDAWYAVIKVWEHPDGSCTVEDEQNITFDEAAELLGFSPLFPEAGSEPGVIVNEFFELIWVVNWKGLYVRVAETVEINGHTGLYVSQGVLEENGSVVIPLQDEPGVKITGISVALVPTLEDISSPTPNVVASGAMLFEDYNDDSSWLDLLPSWLKNLDLGRIIDWLRSLVQENRGQVDPAVIEDALGEATEELSGLGYWIIKHS